MKIRYVFDEIVPSTQTDTEQVLNTVSALGRRGIGVELLIPRRNGCPTRTADELREYYQLEGEFEVRELPARITPVRPLEKAAHSVQALSTMEPVDVWYTRNLSSIAAGLLGGYRVAYDHFRPWSDQYPPMEPVLRALMLHPRFLGALLHSEHCRESYLRIGIPAERLEVAHNGYEPKKLRDRLTRQQARALVGLVPMDPVGPVAAYAGHINERKGLDVLLDLARSTPEMTLLLIGSEGDGPVEQAARSVKNVQIIPWQKFDRTVAYLQAADFLLVPMSLSPLQRHGNTVLPMKLFTYLASGRVIVAPLAPDTAELLKNGENALLVEPGDVDGARQAIRQAWSDGDAWERLAQGARRTSEGLTWDARAERIETFLEKRLRACNDRWVEGGGWSAGDWILRSAKWLQRAR